MTNWILLWVSLLLFGVSCVFVWRNRKRTKRLDTMLKAAIDSSFQEAVFDESAESALEAKMARFLNGCAVSSRNLAKEKASIQSLISDISHQTKTPIANILLYASLLAEGNLTAEQVQQAKALVSQAEKLSFLVDSLVKGSRLETGILSVHPVHCPVEPILQEVAAQVRPAAEAKGITLTVCPTSVTALFDPKWTVEALNNVVDNGVKYTPAGGMVTISAMEYEMFCRIDVTDTGIGIPEEEQSKIFQRFYRGKAVLEQPGVGLGLHLVREILAAQNGYGKVTARPEGGSQFSLFLPKK